jgi:hypothetical protein
VTKAGARYEKIHGAHTKSPALACNYTPVGEVLFTFAHHFGKYFRYLGFRDVKMESEDARRGPPRQINQPESIIATAASPYKAKRSVLRKNGTDASSTEDA